MVRLLKAVKVDSSPHPIGKEKKSNYDISGSSFFLDCPFAGKESKDSFPSRPPPMSSQSDGKRLTGTRSHDSITFNNSDIFFQSSSLQLIFSPVFTNG
ncbi:MAG: hypothetical protein D3908_10695 [Candidatus Electrothrix sp. AUS4]|nr:hypothetical protein [Candidatus Electrothrix sp. AUS4]